MKRRILVVLFALGTIGGFASGISSMRWRAHHRREAFEQHVARVCVDAARASQAEANAAAAAGRDDTKTPAAAPRAD